MRKQRNILQTKEQDKTPEKSLRETKRSNLPDKEFKSMVIKMFEWSPNLGEEWMNRENFNKERENIRMYQTGLTNNIVTELKNILEGFSSRPDEAEKKAVIWKTGH